MNIKDEYAKIVTTKICHMTKYNIINSIITEGVLSFRKNHGEKEIFLSETFLKFLNS